MKINILGNQYSILSVGIFAFLVLIVAYYLGSRTGKAKTEAQKSAEKNSDPLTYGTSQYGSWADKLYEAMFPLADDEDAVYAVMSKMRTKSDVLQLIDSFGTRRLQFTLGNTSLPFWINTKLDDSEIAKINDILARNNISYEF